MKTEKRKNWEREWRRRNPDKVAMYTARHREKRVSATRAWRVANPGASNASRAKRSTSDRRAHNLKRYGVTVSWWENTLKLQSGRCEICCGELGLSHNDPCVDHDHDTGKVRALLCRQCNLHVGFYETIDREAIASYLGRYGS